MSNSVVSETDVQIFQKLPASMPDAEKVKEVTSHAAAGM